MVNRGTDEQKSRRLSGTLREAIFLVVISAVVTFIALTILKATSFHPETPDAARFTGIRHEAASMEPEALKPGEVSKPAPDQGLETSDTTEIRNGVTVLSPKLRIPVVDVTALQAATEPNDTSLPKASTTGKQPRYVKRSRSRAQSQTAARRWRAYGFATR